MFYAFFQYKISKKIVLTMNGARSISKKDAPVFYSAVESISITAGIPMPKLYIIKDHAMNDFAAGTSPEDSIISATTVILENIDKV